MLLIPFKKNNPDKIIQHFCANFSWYTHFCMQFLPLSIVLQTILPDVTNAFLDVIVTFKCALSPNRCIFVHFIWSENCIAKLRKLHIFLGITLFQFTYCLRNCKLGNFALNQISPPTFLQAYVTKS